MRPVLVWSTVLWFMACQRVEPLSAPPQAKRSGTTKSTQVPVNAAPAEVDPAWFTGDMPDDFEVYAGTSCLGCNGAWIRLRARGYSEVPNRKPLLTSCAGIADGADLEQLWRSLPAEELAARANGKLGGNPWKCWKEDPGETVSTQVQVTARGHTVKIVLWVLPPCDLYLAGPWSKRVFDTHVTISTCEEPARR
jgi:hypothetical protein